MVYKLMESSSLLSAGVLPGAGLCTASLGSFERMTMGNQYHIDIEQYSLQRFKDNLKSRDLIPSRVSLKDRLDENFRVLELNGITNLKELIDTLKTKSKIERFSEETGLSVEYLTLLKREAGSYVANPVRLDKFAGIPAEYTRRLEAEGIKNSRQLFDAAKDKTARAQIAQRIQVPVEALDELVCLSDLVRAYGVGPAFARMLYDMGIQTIEAFCEHSAQDIIRIYEKKEQKKADFGVNEIQFSIELARELDIAVEI